MRCRIEPQSADAIAARCSRIIAAKAVTCFAPLIVARKGLYTALAKWARGKGFANCASTAHAAHGEMAAARSLRRTQHRAAGGDADGERRARSLNCETRSTRAGAWAGRGSCAPNTGRAATTPRRAFSPPSAPARTAAPAFRNSIRVVLVQFTARLVQELFRHRLAVGGVRRRTKRRGIAMAGRRRLAEAVDCPDCGGERLNPVARRVLFRGMSIAALTNLPVQEFAAALRKIQAGGPRARDRPRPARRARPRAPRFSATSASAICSSTAPPPRCPAARRSGFVWPRSWVRICRECATSSTSRRSACTRATTSRCSARSIDCGPSGQYAGRGRARRGHDSPRRSRHRSGPRRRARAAARGGAGHRGATRSSEQFGDRPLPCGAAAHSHARRRASTARRPRFRSPARRCTICAKSMRAFLSAA
jgi:hypothetical protein